MFAEVASTSSSAQSSVYIHWPYCEKRCTYCNFNKYVSNNVDHEVMTSCLVEELNSVLSETGVSQITTVFFGGGTPNLMKPCNVESLLKHILPLMPDAYPEVSLECNPKFGTEQQLRDFKSSGISRISVGLQSLSDFDRKLLGRTHTAREAISFVEAAEELFPGRTSVDVIYGRPGQTLHQWVEELHNVLQLGLSHVSLYELSVERGTQLFKDASSGKLCLPSQETRSEMYIAAVEALEKAGLHRYEASNFAKVGHECAHNQRYWKGLQYIGVGPGAHSRLDFPGHREARIQTLEPVPWMQEVKARGHGTRLVRRQTSSDRLGEMLMLGMRTAAGISNEDWVKVPGAQSLMNTFQGSPCVQSYIKNGFLRLNESLLQATGAGMNVADSITCSLLPLTMEEKDDTETRKDDYWSTTG
ncbi:radical S-adenosyl methionine domain-containing protein 1, mitochondrial-like isoform X3 [Ornithodoros turicata]|uniref:radical S-adenosyl methionine domain-containing protein 1, mitochondrial-like isoform X3 n=1 Tax=Ornithodoros turicata TaxID=34597 RepID=UPI0031399FF8